MTQDYTMEIAPDYPYGEQGEEKGSAAEGQGEKEGEGANAEQQQQSEHPQEGGQQQGQPNQDQNIPLHVLQAIRQENQQLKAEVDRIKQQHTQQPQGGDDDDPYKGYDPDDVVTVADIKKIMSKQSPQKGQEQGQQQGQQGQPAWTPQDIPIMENQIRQKHTDYDNTIQQLPNLTNQYPHLLEDIKRSSNPPLTAYAYVKHLLGDQQHQSQGGQGGNKQMAGDADKALKNLERPGSAGKVSGQSAISQTGYFAGMSDEELEQHMAKVKRGS